MYHQLLERLIDYAAAEGGDEALSQGRREFFSATGEISEDDASFELRLAAFIEWFTVERRDPTQRTWAERFLDTLPAEERVFGAFLAATHRSLFTVKKLKEDELWLVDLLGGAHFFFPGEPPAGLQKNDIVEARIFPWIDRIYLGRHILYHPSEARDMINRQVLSAKANREPREILLSRLARMRLRMERYRKIPIEKIYDPDAIFGR